MRVAATGRFERSITSAPAPSVGRTVSQSRAVHPRVDGLHWACAWRADTARNPGGRDGRHHWLCLTLIGMLGEALAALALLALVGRGIRHTVRRSRPPKATA
jgi:hypothetical protein